MRRDHPESITRHLRDALRRLEISDLELELLIDLGLLRYLRVEVVQAILRTDQHRLECRECEQRHEQQRAGDRADTRRPHAIASGWRVDDTQLRATRLGLGRAPFGSASRARASEHQATSGTVGSSFSTARSRALSARGLVRTSASDGFRGASLEQSDRRLGTTRARQSGRTCATTGLGVAEHRLHDAVLARVVRKHRRSGLLA